MEAREQRLDRTGGPTGLLDSSSPDYPGAPSDTPGVAGSQDRQAVALEQATGTSTETFGWFYSGVAFLAGQALPRLTGVAAAGIAGPILAYYRPHAQMLYAAWAAMGHYGEALDRLTEIAAGMGDLADRLAGLVSHASPAPPLPELVIGPALTEAAVGEFQSACEAFPAYVKGFVAVLDAEATAAADCLAVWMDVLADVAGTVRDSTDPNAFEVIAERRIKDRMGLLAVSDGPALSRQLSRFGRLRNAYAERIGLPSRKSVALRWPREMEELI